MKYRLARRHASHFEIQHFSEEYGWVIDTRQIFGSLMAAKSALDRLEEMSRPPAIIEEREF